MSMTRSAIARSQPTGLYDILDLILDKGLVIDAFVRVSVIGIEILTVDARIVIASVDTYLRFAEAVNRLDLNEGKSGGLPDLAENMTEGGAHGKTKGALSGAADSISDAFGGGRGEGHGEKESQAQRKRPQASGGNRRPNRSDGGEGGGEGGSGGE